MNDWCGHCGQPLIETDENSWECPDHGTPEFTVNAEDAERIADEQRHNFNG